MAEQKIDPQKEIYDNNNAWIIISVFLIILISVWIILVFYLNAYLKTNSPNLKVYLTCNPGECSTIRSTGEKHCPVNPGDLIVYNPEFEVCNPKYACTDPTTPLAVMSNGETNVEGICEPNSICRCVVNPSCSNDTLVLFNMVNGNLYNELDNSTRATFQQVLITENTFTNYTNQFCAIKANHLGRIAPGACTFIDDHKVSLTELQNCMNTVNSCITGQIAFVPQDPTNFLLNKDNTNAIYDIPVSCMPPIAGTGPISQQAATNNFVGHINNFCTGQSVPVYDKNTGKINCYVTYGDF